MLQRLAVVGAGRTSPPERWYTPSRVRFLLVHLDELAEGRFPARPETERLPRRQRSIGWPAENAVIVHADLTAALARLPWFGREVVCRHLVDGQAIADVARALGCDWQTVQRQESRAIHAMAVALGWDGRLRDEGLASPTIWRRDD